MDWLTRIWRLISVKGYEASNGGPSLRPLFMLLAGIAVGCALAAIWQAQAWLLLSALMLFPAIVSTAITLRLSNMIRIDHKTGLFNSQYFDVRFHQAFQQAKQRQESASVIVIDVDLLKNVNDTYGHLAGDAVLSSLGALLREHVRGCHLAGRLGGDEFSVILPDMVVGDAHIVAARLCRAIASAEVYVSTASDGIRITASAGVAQISARHAQAEDWFHAADTALIRAKQLGRNCVVIAPPDQTMRAVSIGNPSKPLGELLIQEVPDDEPVACPKTSWQWIVKPHKRF
jgi:diguanylate cyclase (GGDEF)-like protein